MRFLFPHLINCSLLLTVFSTFAADLELSETLQLPECYNIGWVRANAGVKGQGAGNIFFDEAMRKKHNALWHCAVEPKTGHGPGEKTWPLVFSFLRHSFAARVPAEADASKGPVKLNELNTNTGFLGQNWDPKTSGYQTLPTSSFADFQGDKTSASWLLNAAYATDWQTFQCDGQLKK